MGIEIKSIGVLRKLDSPGRITPPIEWENLLGIKKGSKIFLIACGGTLIVSKNPDPSTFAVKNVDSLGRIAIPKGFRSTAGIRERELMEILCDGKNLYVRKYEGSFVNE